MMYLFIIFMLCCGYYSFTYGVNLWRKDKNRLGGMAMIILSIIGTLIPAFVMFIKY
jgi:hypothetical protein